MTPLSNTPPDGDFARYVEELTQRNLVLSTQRRSAENGAPASAAPPPAYRVRRDAPAATSASTPASASELLKPFAGLKFLTHLKWLVVAWVASQLLSQLVPGAGFYSCPS